MKRRLLATLTTLVGGAALSLAATAPARADFEGLIQSPSAPRPTSWFEVDGFLRLRTEALYNLDLDRGPTPSGTPLFPVPFDDPAGQTLTGADMLLRADLAVASPGGAVRVKSRLNLLGNAALGSEASGVPIATTSQEARDPVEIARLWGEVLTPLGVLAAGRMGSGWGLGMLANSGDCFDCDTGDTADRITFVSPLVGHTFGVAYDFSSTGVFGVRPAGNRGLDASPDDDVRSVTVVMLRWLTEESRQRRLRADRLTLEYGAYGSYRWQDRDVPADYLPVDAGPDAPDGPAATMDRGYRAFAIDGWARFASPWVRLEVEAALLLAELEQASVIPGVLLPEPVRSRQLGAALVSEVGPWDGRLLGGLDAGFASGDPAPGFGAFVSATGAAPRAGNLDGIQTVPGQDDRVDNFRFQPDYHIDRILFRQIIGTVTDAWYLRPHVRYALFRFAPGQLWAQLAGVSSFVVEPNSAPGGKAPLGLELDPSLSYVSKDGFLASVDYAVLFPLAGLDNAATGQEARPAQLWQLHLGYRF